MLLLVLAYAVTDGLMIDADDGCSGTRWLMNDARGLVLWWFILIDCEDLLIVAWLILDD